MTDDDARPPRSSRGRRLVAGALIAALAVVGVACGDSSGDEAATSDTLIGLARTEPLDVAAVSLPDAHTGEPSSVVPEPGQLTIVYFGYTSCPDVCPTTMSDVQRAMEQLDPEQAEAIEFVFVTVDPQRDTADVLDKYVGYFFDRQRSLRTEDVAQLEQAQEAFLASSSIDPTGPDTYEVSHSAVTYVVDEDGKVVVEWPFGTSSDTIAHDLEILTARAAEGGATTPAA